ncbi:MAG TPA: hypothetical protein VFQ82_10015 [Stellaceae bacterium]|nr:hypothetical protein [Stellaceae bacterium]
MQCEAMRPLAGAALLTAWERGSGQPPIARALTLIAAGCPAMSETEAMALSLAQRDLALLDLRRSSFRRPLSLFRICGGCGERLEFTLDEEPLVATLQNAAAAECSLEHAGYTVRLRLASSADVAAAVATSDLDVARSVLLAHCVVAVGKEGQMMPFGALPQEVRDTALARLEALHDAAELSVTLSCPDCGAGEAAVLDIPALLWAEARHAALALLDEVHELAWAYGWAEAAILAMSPARRRAYLDRLNA